MTRKCITRFIFPLELEFLSRRKLVALGKAAIFSAFIVPEQAAFTRYGASERSGRGDALDSSTVFLLSLRLLAFIKALCLLAREEREKKVRK